MDEIQERIKRYVDNLNLSTMMMDEDAAKAPAKRVVGSINHIIDSAIEDLQDLRKSEVGYIADLYNLEADGGVCDGS